MSIAMAATPVAVYREEQWFGWWVYGLLAVIMALVAGFFVALAAGSVDASEPWWRLPGPLSLMLGLSLPPLLCVGVLKMTTEVTAGRIYVWFGVVPTYHHVILLEAVRGVEVVRYRPIRDCGGWGIRREWKGGRVLNARGDRGVRLTLDDGSHLLIGSQRPEELAQVIDGAIRPAA